jgi:ferredoxin
MPTLTIDNRTVSVPVGSTVLDACRAINIEVPTLCTYAGLEPFTSCMVCVVRNVETNRLIPSCSARAEEYMVIDTVSETVRDARRTALDLLLSEHVGDCEGPCRRACPADMDIPLMLRQIRGGQLEAAIRTVKTDIALPAVLGRICPAPCEKACRRGKHDSPVTIRLLKQLVADLDLAAALPWQPEPAPDSGRRVAVVGAGPCGLAAAYQLRRLGHACTLFDESEKPGGALRYAVEPYRLPRNVLDADVRALLATGITTALGLSVGRDIPVKAIREEFDAVLLATGSAERVDSGWGVLFGPRGIHVDRESLQTAAPGVFAGGMAVGHGHRLAVRSLADGKRMAFAADAWLRGVACHENRYRFHSVIGPLLEGELDTFLANAAQGPSEWSGAGKTFQSTDTDSAKREAARCLQCDCQASRDCLLRQYADAAGARQARYRQAGTRRALVKVRERHQVIYEPGKCVKCGICVRITQARQSTLGLTFIGRGFDVRVGAAMNTTLSSALGEAAAACVAACPTGALIINGKESR